MIGHGLDAAYTREEIVEIVKLIRLSLYNQGLHCGTGSIRKEMEKECIEPMPSERTIGRILSCHGLTHGRTGFLESD